MDNARSGYDSTRGAFHLMTLAEAQTLARVLIQQAYVQFEDTVYHQTTGIPMGINPAVFYANLYLLSFELEFLEQFKPLLRIGRGVPAVPVFTGPMQHIVHAMVSCTTAAQLQAADLPGQPYLRFAASELLEHFRWFKRYADDTTVGPNPYITLLLYTDQVVLGGEIHGLYPRTLTLEQQDSTVDKCVALDLRILTNETSAAAPGTPGYAYCYTVLYDKRRLPCFAAFDVLHFQHVTSCQTRGQAYNMLHGRLCHLLRIITDVECFILEAARCIHHMKDSGYDVLPCFTCAHRFLRKHPDAFGMKHWRLSLSIRTCYERIAAAGAAAVAGSPDEWHPKHSTTVAPMYPKGSSDMDISDSLSSDVDLGD
jgi:hypothetical protein